MENPGRCVPSYATAEEAEEACACPANPSSTAVCDTANYLSGASQTCPWCCSTAYSGEPGQTCVTVFDRTVASSDGGSGGGNCSAEAWSTYEAEVVEQQAARRQSKNKHQTSSKARRQVWIHEQYVIDCVFIGLLSLVILIFAATEAQNYLAIAPKRAPFWSVQSQATVVFAAVSLFYTVSHVPLAVFLAWSKGSETTVALVVLSMELSVRVLNRSLSAPTAPTAPSTLAHRHL